MSCREHNEKGFREFIKHKPPIFNFHALLQTSLSIFAISNPAIMKKAQQIWIEKGYQVFAYEGPQELKVERLSKSIGKNKSSFYHYFAELEIFISELLVYHFEQAKIMAAKEAQCTSRKEFISIILEHKLDLLFNRQLRIHRENPEFEACFVKINHFSTPAMIGVWSEIIGLKENSHLAELVLRLSLENFFLQITDETLNTTWLNQYFDQLRSLIQAFQKKEVSISVLDGSV